jgi:hypothetical protein
MIYISGPGVSRFLVEVVSTPEELRLGLSNRRVLAPRHGMLFIFPDVSVQSMWMKKMYFPLDIVWISSNNVITKIYENVQPCYLDNNCKSYSSITPALYGLELNAFDAERMGLTVGKELKFHFNS